MMPVLLEQRVVEARSSSNKSVVSVISGLDAEILLVGRHLIFGRTFQILHFISSLLLLLVEFEERRAGIPTTTPKSFNFATIPLKSY